ncbi:MAG: benzoate-CoA ligase family protein [Planctomycetes bacterium]|nr:benzoate-CoA ligase family protein [Planctomycetota bacterium]
MVEYPDRFNLASWLLDHNVAVRPGKVAVRADAGDRTYAEVADAAARVHALLKRLGHQHEQRALLVLPDGIEFVACWLGTVRAGGVFAMVNPRLSAEEYAYYLDYSRAPVAFVHVDAWAPFVQGARGARFLRAAVVVGAGADACVESRGGFAAVPFAAAIAAETAAAAPFDSHRDDLCGWLFTSGTSGKPKAAMHYHADFAWNIDHYAKELLGLRESDVTMAVSKLFFGYATGTNLMFPFSVGATTALFPEPSKPEVVLQQATRHRPTLLATVPTTLSGILELDPVRVADAFTSLRLVLSAGEALPPQLATAFRARFGVDILDGIGSAEMFHIYISNAPSDVVAGSLGRVVPGYSARIVGDDGRDVADGEVGALHVSGPSVAQGYFEDAKKSRATFKGDTCVSGDLFRRDRDGRYWYEGRGDELLKVAGIWVAPREVEECLLGHPAVRECCVVGCEDERGLVTPLAWVALHDGEAATPSSAESIVAHARAKLANYKAPRRVRFLDALPRNDRGKIARNELRARANTAERA